MTSNQINTDNSNNYNLIQISNNNVKYYEKQAEQYAKNAEKSVAECASYLGAAQRCITECQNVKDSLAGAVTDSINIHAEDTENPHQVTAQQTGAYTKNEVDAIVTGLVDDIEDVETTASAAYAHSQLTTGNPHNVTAAQVGAYTKTEVDSLLSEAGSDSEEVQAAYAHSQLTTGNPHNVTASQVGAYTKSEVDALISSSSSSSVDLSAYYTSAQVDSSLAQKADLTLENTPFATSGLYITQTADDTEWSRAFYSDALKTNLVWLEQGGYKAYTTSIDSADSATVTVTFTTPYNNGYYSRTASTVKSGFTCSFTAPSSSIGGTSMSISVTNNNSTSGAPTGIWWQTAGVPSESGGFDSGGDWEPMPGGGRS